MSCDPLDRFDRQTDSNEDYDWDCIDAGGGYVADDCDVYSEEDWNDERQPDEAQEWHDFDPDC